MVLPRIASCWMADQLLGRNQATIMNLGRNIAGPEHGHHLHVLMATLTIRRLLDTQSVFI